MPIYEFKCSGCGTVWDGRQRGADALLTKHEVCGGDVERLLSAPALQFKGSGWYITDYARGGNSSKSDSNGASKSGESKSKSESKSDSGTSSSTTTSSSSDKK